MKPLSLSVFRSRPSPFGLALLLVLVAPLAGTKSFIPSLAPGR